MERVLIRDPKTVQGMLRHSDIRTTMNLYTQDDPDEKQAAQGAFLSAVGLGSRLGVKFQEVVHSI